MVHFEEMSLYVEMSRLAVLQARVLQKLQIWVVALSNIVTLRRATNTYCCMLLMIYRGF